MNKHIQTTFCFVLFLMVSAWPGLSEAASKCRACPSCSIVGAINGHTNAEFNELQRWMLNDFWGRPGDGRNDTVRARLKAMTDELTAAGIAMPKHYGETVDARLQQETELEKEIIHTNTKLNYTPNAGFCSIVSGAPQGMKDSDLKSESFRTAIVKSNLQRNLAKKNTVEAGGPTERAKADFAEFQKYCDPADNNGGMKDGCTQIQDATIVDKNLNYTSLAAKSTIPFDAQTNTFGPEGQAANAFVSKLFRPAGTTIGAEAVSQEATAMAYMDKRALVPKRDVGTDCFARVLSKKASGSDAGVTQMRNMLIESGVPPEVAAVRVSDNPSWAERLEMSSRQMTSSGSFYTGMMGREVNVNRQQNAIQQTGLNLKREIFESVHCSEMMLSLIVDNYVTDFQKSVQNVNNEN